MQANPDATAARAALLVVITDRLLELALAGGTLAEYAAWLKLHKTSLTNGTPIRNRRGKPAPAVRVQGGDTLPLPEAQS